jgi:WD40 repeat protein
LRIWNFRTGKLLHELGGHRDWIRAVLFVPGRDEIITAGNDRRLLRWTLSEGGVAHRQLAQHDQAIAALAIDGAGNRLAATGFEPHMCLYDLKTNKRTACIDCPCRDMRAATFSPAGDMLAAAGRNGRIRVWAVDDFQHQRDIEAHRQRIRALAFSPDGRHLVSASEDRTTRIWNVTTGEAEKVLGTGSAKIMSAAYLDENHLATGGSDNVIRVWRIDTQEEVSSLIGHTGSVATLEGDNGTLISGSFDTTVRVWHPLTPATGADRRFGAAESLK